MRKLFDHIEDIHIKGTAAQLTRAVTAMDDSLQDIASATEQLAGYLLRYSNTNQGIQFAKAVEAVVKLSKILFDASLELNEMQNEVVRYQNKIYRYEDMSQSAAKPNKHTVQKVNISMVSTSVQFSMTDMANLVKSLESYFGYVLQQGNTLVNKKNQLAGIWLDSQYKTFSDFIDEVVGVMKQALKKLDEYRMHLDAKLKELG